MKERKITDTKSRQLQEGSKLPLGGGGLASKPLASWDHRCRRRGAGRNEHCGGNSTFAVPSRFGIREVLLYTSKFYDSIMPCPVMRLRHSICRRPKMVVPGCESRVPFCGAPCLFVRPCVIPLAATTAHVNTTIATEYNISVLSLFVATKQAYV